MKVRYTIISAIMLLTAVAVQAQITIGGSVYGGGNEGKVEGSTSVTVRAGDLNNVYGGARKADVGGSAFVNIDGEHASDNIFITSVYGGNDIAGTVGSNPTHTDPVPSELTKVGTGAGKNAIDNTWNAFVRTTPTPVTSLASARKSLVIGSLFGGGNGDYDYTSDDSPYKGLVKPELGKTYLEILGGCIAHLYGGGNNATVTANTTICIDNDSPVLTETNVWPDDPTTAEGQAQVVALAKRAKLTTFQSNLTSYAFNFARVFGGNNKAEMKIRPIWNLQNGIIRDLYGGGNRGEMTSPEGLLLNIEKGSKVVVENLYGGCRIADVIPKDDSGNLVTASNLTDKDEQGNQKYFFPDGFSARVVISGGDINNVYGGNDISGKVYGGNAVGIRTSVRGDVYGGGNGSYAYTDNAALGQLDEFRDFYYDPSSVPGAASSVEALQAVRPNAEQVSIRLIGTEDKPTIVHGGIFCGGNSATIMSKDDNPTVELKIGSYVIADSVFLGNNGANMVKKDILEQYAGNVTYNGTGYKYSTMDLTNSNTFATYMDGAALSLMPSVVFDSKANGDAADYEEYTSYFGSFFCGGNVGSMKVPGKTTVNFNKAAYIYNKVVGGCNSANIYAQAGLNAEYLGGLLGDADNKGNKLELNFNGLKIQPKRWKVDNNGGYVLDEKGNPQLEWNTISAATGQKVAPVTSGSGKSDAADLDRRFKGGNVYGGCYNSGHVNGNVVINLNATLHERDKLFDVTDEGDILYENAEKADYTISKRNTGVILSEQGTDAFGSALNVFGGGYGGDSEVWGSTTINLNKGYTFQIFGGGEMGAIGKAENYNETTGKLEYLYNQKYGTFVNLNGASSLPGVARGADGDSGDMAECEYLYGGAFEGLIAGDTHVKLNNGRVFNSFAGSCNADILGHAETYIGLNGFPYVRDYAYGGNDLGGKISGKGDFSGRIRSEVKDMVNHSYEEQVEKVAAYMEYTQGRVDFIIGGSSGNYDYEEPVYKNRVASKPYLHNTFVNIRANTNPNNAITKIFGAGEGCELDRDGDGLQDHSYVLVDIPDGIVNFANTEVFGAGTFNGLGMRFTPDEAKAAPDEVSAIIDLARGQIANAYGGSYNQGITRRSVVNVPEGSTARVANIFGGAYGVDPLIPCDVYEAQVNYRSENATVTGAIYGGNNNADRTLYGQVNIYSPVWSNKDKGYLATVYGAGYGKDTWSQYTEINLEAGARVYEAYGGGNSGMVLNKESLEKWAEIEEANGSYLDLQLGDYVENGLDNDLVKPAALDGVSRYNTNVHIKEGATIVNYCYGGGYGADAVVSGTTYVDLLGGTVAKDIYGSGTSGDVRDYFEAKNFTASTNVYVKGGTVRNVYGGGWRGGVGWHDGDISAVANNASDILGEAHVVVGDLDGTSFVNGVPAVKRNVYGGGEGGGVFGTTFVTVNNGYVGYRYEDGQYVEELDESTEGDNVLDRSGNVFGGGYVANSYVDVSDVKMYGGTVRGSLYGGGEIAPIGRGTVKEGAAAGVFANGDAKIYKPGETRITMYKGRVLRNVFGGGRGKDNWNGEGYMTDEEKATMDLSSKGYVFGKTDVNIHGGSIGSLDGVVKGYGNVFGGGDLGFVYSASGTKGGDNYYHDADNNLTEDCRVSVKVLGYATAPVTINGTSYAVGDAIPNEVLCTLANGDPAWSKIDQEGITINNGIFAGGNVSSGSSDVFAFSTTVFGNATASVVDVFARDLVSVGGDGIGGIYGDGNLTYVDGYRELNISNYGTDFYALPSSMDLTDPETLSQYNKLTERQKAIYVVKYKFDGSPEGNYKDLYEAGDVILSDEYNKLTDVQKPHWTAVHSVINEGRYINTIQRCDFCGIIGSRLVLRGAMDRAQDNEIDQADFTNYTINRVGELSLNQWHSLGEDVPGDVIHGCYFGIYNVVKLLGAVTSDVKFDDVRETASTLDNNKADGKTYWQWKVAKKDDNNVNNGSSWNKIALASGVFLEIVKNFKENGEKEYGPITGIVELDLLNVTPGEGGGYVYAENLHGNRSLDEAKAIAAVLSDANKAQGGCRTNAGYSYSAPGVDDNLETSGNFVSSLKDIIDDCFPVSKSWMPGGAPAHYWYIRGEFYVYDQEVSAYTGSADAYSAEISIPLTMVAQSNAKLRILNILPGLYADPTQFDPSKSYFDADLNTWKSDSLEIVYDNVTKRFGQNDPISYWDWYMTNKANQSRFVTETYSCHEQITVNGVTYYPGQGILPATYNSLKDVPGVDAYGASVANAQEKFAMTNGILRDNGYVLTLDMTNPSKWNDYYTALANSGDKLTSYQWNNLTNEQKKNYVESATFRCNAGGTYGQYYFTEGEIISQAVHDMQTTTVSDNATKTQAAFERAYIAVDSCEVTIGGEPRIMQRNATIPASVYGGLSGAEKSHFKLAKVCGSTFSVNDKELYVIGQVVAESSPIASTGGYAANFTDAWYCIGEGSWGGLYYEEGQNYNGVKYCQLLPEERKNFTFNYDALDLLATNFTQDGSDYPTQEQLAHAGTDHNHQMLLYDGTNADKVYSVPVRIDYEATYKGTGTFRYKADDGSEIAVTNGTKLESDDYQNLPNDFAHYATIHVNDNHKVNDDTDPDNGNYVVYVVWNTFDVGGTMYNAGKVITKIDYDGLGSLKTNVDKVVLTPTQQQSSSNGVFYYCIDEYTVGDKDNYVVGFNSPTLTDIDAEDYGIGKTVEVGTIISSSKMTAPNYQKDFEVSGQIPMEQTTLYVPVTADYNELLKDRYVTVIFEYTYTESDAQGLNFETRVEKHILNLRIKFKSGKPIIGKLKEPGYVLPLESVGISIPFIQESANAFPILKGGFEIYGSETDALKHHNGREFTSSTEPVYFYEDMNYVAYFVETRMGRTYSDPVPIHVANYHRMSDVINDPEHMYINHSRVRRNPKIYIDSRTVTGKDYNELDAMKEMFDIVNSDYGRKAADNTEKNHGRDIRGANGLEFFVQDDVKATRSWTPIGNESNCFAGNFHGNGHTLSDMSASLFGKLCGNVYNIGVMGSFTGGGVADSGGGRIENSWVSTTGTPTGKAIIKTTDGNPTIINGYYPETQAFTAHDAGVDVTKRSVSDFANGRVAYDLNRFYLEARYNLFTRDENVSGNPVKNDSALFLMPDGTLEMETTADGKQYPVPHGLFYTSDYAWHSGVSATNTDKKYGYVESLYEDGDFRFAHGLKPQTSDMRLSQYAGYLPIFPDDYIFFGQRLSYGLYSDKPHDAVPMGVVKDRTVTTETDAIDNSRSGLLTDDETTENRVYRAPAYFRNGTLGETAMFNAHAAFVDTYNGIDAYKNMTAIDFSGSNGDTNGMQGVVPGAESDFTTKAQGYGPRLDFVRIDRMATRGLTQNLLAYAPDPSVANTMNAQTAENLKNWASELTYAEGETNPGYRTVAVQDYSTVNGHMVQKNGNTFLSLTDHFLVDKQDFNAPMAYVMGAGKRMWYQREPDNYVEKDKGWEAVSLPFTAEIVTTQDKGEITHFYGGSEKGHEYWLRQYKGGSMLSDNTTFKANMKMLDAGTEEKYYRNTYLWDYYYSQDGQKDKNADKYQEYYSESHTYNGYPYLANGTPYVIGFPGSRYYEFDLSGVWTPVNRFNDGIIESPGQQTITFASKPGAAIGVSDAEMASGKATANGYTFLPNYMSQPIAAGAGYLLDAEGGSFKKSADDAVAVPFRPYFTAGNNARTRGIAEQIVFGGDDSIGGIEENDPRSKDAYGTLKIYPKRHMVVVESSLKLPIDVRIMNPAGITLKTFTVEPGQTVETRVNFAGVYLVQSTDGYYIKKLSVR